ncbi:MAG: hypothetical protein U1E86_28775 [Burkholderiaceae bacterium]
MVVDLREAPLPADGGVAIDDRDVHQRRPSPRWPYRWSKHLNCTGLHREVLVARVEVAIQPPGEKEASLLRDNGWCTVDLLAAAVRSRSSTAACRRRAASSRSP